LSAARWVLSLVAGFVVTSGLNWVVAEKYLNPLIKPGLDGLMRTGGDTQVGVLSAGFALIVAVVAVLTAIVRSPVHWLGRGVVVGALVSAAAFFGAYTFLSGWMYLPTGEMCRTAIADSLTVTVGATFISFIQHFRRDPAPATGDPAPRPS
jgi:hypothetical protein